MISPDLTEKVRVKFEGKDQALPSDHGKYSPLCRLFQELCATVFPPGSKFLWLCLTVDREAIESMLRVYGPPAKQVLEAIPLSLPSVRTKEIPFLPYVAAVNTTWAKADRDDITNSTRDGPQVDDGKYRGQFKCALRSVFRLWQMEQVIHPQELYPKNGKVWGDINVVFETPPRV